MSDVPSLTLFQEPGNGNRKGVSRAKSFVIALKPNTPASTGYDSIYRAAPMRVVAKKVGRDVRFRTVDGVVWACWVTDEVAS